MNTIMKYDIDFGSLTFMSSIIKFPLYYIFLELPDPQVNTVVYVFRER